MSVVPARTGTWHSERRPYAPKPQYTARFRKSGKLRFPDLRREADAQHRRWEAKRPPTLPLTSENGS